MVYMYTSYCAVLKVKSKMWMDVTGCQTPMQK